MAGPHRSVTQNRQRSQPASCATCWPAANAWTGI